ncbi:MAG: nuclear transport factor 2 family protein [Flavobacteriales bacterium]|nr:nuclear transport factor 2 family protein [Flavobacteriales bacterium]
MKYLDLFLVLSFTALVCTSCNPAQEQQPEPLDQTQEAARIHQLMDGWHQAAAQADEEVFFGNMSDSAIYLGTDKSERWLRDELRSWSARFFERDTAWAFTPYDRELYFSDTGRTVWFEELLETWMGPCRGSGVLTWAEGQWKIQHYNLAMLIDNEDVSEVLEIIQQPDVRPDSLPGSQ